MSDVTLRALHDAVKDELCHEVERLVKSGASLEQLDEAGRTPLLLALAKKHHQITLLLLELGADPDVTNQVGATPMYLAIRRNNMELLTKLLQKKATVDYNALSEACHLDSAEMLEKMLDSDKSSIDCLDNNGDTLLIQLIKIQKTDLIEALIKHGCNVNSEDKDDWSPLQHAVHVNNAQIAKILIEAGASFKCFTKRFYRLSILNAISNKNATMLKMLMSQKERMYKFSESCKKNILSKAILSNDLGVLNELKTLLLDIVHMVDDDGRNSLMIASCNGMDKAVETLIEWKVPMNIRDNSGRDALYLAAWEQHLDVIELLLKNNYQSNFQDVDNPDSDLDEYPNAVYIAICKKNKLKLIERLITALSDQELMKLNCKNESLIHASVLNDRVYLIPMLKKRGVNPEVRNLMGKTALDIAHDKRNLDMVIKLLETDGNSNAYTILMREIVNANRENVKILIDCDSVVTEKHIEAAIKLELLQLHTIDLKKMILDDGNRLIDTCLGVLLLENQDTVSVHTEYAMDYALKTNNRRVYHLLCDAGLVVTRIINDRDMQCLQEFGMKRRLIFFNEKRNVIETTTLHKAIEKHFVNYLINFNHSVDIDEYSPEGETPLHKAIRLGKEDIAVHLIQHGADVRMSSEELYKYKLTCSDSLYDLLMEAGAAPKSKLRTLEQLARIAVRKCADFDSIWYEHRRTINVPQFPIGTYNIDSTDGLGNTALHYASYIGLYNVAEVLLKDYADPNIKTDDGNTALSIACLMGRFELVLLLIEYGADVSSKNNSLQNNLMQAAQNSKLNSIHKLIEINPTLVNETDVYGNSALHLAVDSGHKDVVEALLKAGSDTLLATNDGNTALHIAVSKGRVDLVSLLLEWKADVSAVTQSLQTCLIIASQLNNADLIEMLLNANSRNVNDKDTLGYTALHLAIKVGRDEDVVNKLLKADADPFIRSKDGNNALHLACETSQLNIATLLLDEGLNAYDRNYKLYTALMLASQQDNSRLIDVLVNAAPELINATNFFGNTALHLAAANGCIENVETLLKYGADVTKENDNAYCAIHFASRLKDPAILSLLVANKADIYAKTKSSKTTLMLAALYDNINVLKILLDLDSSMINLSDEMGKTALHFSALNSNTQFIEELLKKGADQFLKTREDNTALHIAFANNNVESVRLLIKYRAMAMIANVDNKEIVDELQVEDLETMEVTKGYKRIVSSLLKWDADLNIPISYTKILLCAGINKELNINLFEDEADKNSSTVLTIAVMNCDMDIIRMILDKKEDLINEPDDYGMTPLHYAAINQTLPNGEIKQWNRNILENLRTVTLEERIDVLRLLLDRGADVKAMTKKNITALMLIVQSNNVQMVEMVVRADRNTDMINKINVQGMTALHICALYGHLDVARVLLNANANPNMTTDKHESPFIVACNRRHNELVSLLMEKRAEIQTRTKDKKTALMIAVITDNVELTIMFSVKEHELINLTDDYGMTALHYAIIGGNKILVEVLLTAGSDITIQCNEGKNAIQYAALNNQIDIVQQIIHFAYQHKDLLYILIFAVESNNIPLIDRLLRRSSDLVYESGLIINTALHYAAHLGLKDAVEVLLKYEADPCVADDDNTAINVASSKGHTDIVSLLLSKVKNADLRPTLITAIENDDLDLIPKLVEVDSKLISELNYDVLIYATELGKTSSVKLLIDAGFDPRLKFKAGLSPIIVASILGYEDMAKLLLENGADAGDVDGKMRNALMFATINGHVEMMRLILDACADCCNAADLNGFTALHYAARYGHVSAAEILLASGADASIKTADGLTALHIATKRNYADMIGMFNSYY